MNSQIEFKFSQESDSHLVDPRHLIDCGIFSTATYRSNLICYELQSGYNVQTNR